MTTTWSRSAAVHAADPPVRDASGRVAPPAAAVNPIRSRAEWDAVRAECERDPGRYHGDVALRELHWYDPALGRGAWITRGADGRWRGIDAESAEPIAVPYGDDHVPWTRALDERDAPFYRWFAGALTNAGFNEVDRHVAEGHGDEVAFFVEGDRWDQSLTGGRGGPVCAEAITRKRLLLEVAKASVALESLGVCPGDRIALNMPNIPEQVYYTEAAKRLGVIYTPVFGGSSEKTLSDRIHDAGARIVVTSDGAYRNAQVVPFKAAFTDPALDDFVAVEAALATARESAAASGLAVEDVARVVDAVREALTGEITVQRADVMRGVGRALDGIVNAGRLDAAAASRVRTSLARALAATPARADAVIVVRHADIEDVRWRAGRDRWHHELVWPATARLLAAARARGHDVSAEADLLALPDAELTRVVWTLSRPEPLDAEFPLFIIYTSGATGKPKGVVHVHGGYGAGIAHSMRVAFDARPGDVMYVVADPGWITGQSYMITGALTTRTTSVLAEGAPDFPSAGRFASIIERYGVTIFKAGVTFLRGVMQDPQSAADVRAWDLSRLRVATFCAEPTSPAVQQFAMGLVTPWYINSYSATEHGGIVWTHFYGSTDHPLRADAHTYPLPWVFGDVWVADERGTGGEGPGARGENAAGARWRRAEIGEKGEIVVARPYPYLCRTIWGDVARFRVAGARVSPEWKGDAQRYRATYWARWRGTWAYTQGDFAVRYDDGSFSLHGRSDDVINVSGHRLGTEEIEGAILRDRQRNPDSPVGNVIVVGAPHREKGLTPLAFVRTAPGRRLSADDRGRLAELVRAEKGALAVPSDFLEVPQFPETRSGKYVRRMVRALVEDAPVGDASTLRNPEALDELREAIARWKARERASEEQRLLDRWRYFRIEYHAVDHHALAAAAARRVAVVFVANPPVNALNERALDELNTLADHLARRADVAGVVFTGDGSSFVAGADIRQLLEEVHSLDDALPLPNNAHLAFRKIEAMAKPCVAALNGAALGGGLEFALACHYRIAEPTAACGLPEIRLNLLPGYGGTQRLPRLLAARHGRDGLLAALEMILGGRAVDAEQAAALGLVDEVVQGSEDVLTRAVARVREYVGALAEGDGARERSLLARAHALRLLQLERWRLAGPEPFESVLADEAVQRLLAQSSIAGRADAARRAIDAVRTGWEHGADEGLRNEARLFADAVVDPCGGRQGIRDFLDRRGAPLPTRRSAVPEPTELAQLEARGDLLPIGAPFFPGVTPIPRWQYAMGISRDAKTGAPTHGDPIDVERELVTPVESPGAGEALVYVLASEVNFNDVWAITGIPVSPFDAHDADVQTTGSGGLGLVVAAGEDVRREGRLKVGDLVAIYAGQSDLLSPDAARDPMAAGFAIQGYETPMGSHQQFLVVQAPQLHPVPQDLTLEAAGSYILALGTVVRALFTTLHIERGRTMLVEGAATGTGLEAVKVASRSGLDVVGTVSSPERAAVAVDAGAFGTLDRRDPRLAHLFTRVPEGDAAIAEWTHAGEALCDALRAETGGRLADYVVSHAGETAFPRSFQLLADFGALTFYGATSGHHFTFVGKRGAVAPDTALRHAGARAGEAALAYYGPGVGEDGLVDAAALELIEAARAAHLRVAVATYTDAQRDYVASLGFGAAVRGVVSLEELARRGGDDFQWPRTMPPLPDARADAARFREAVRAFQERTVRPFGTAVGRLLRSTANPRGSPDLVLERAGHDALAVSTSLVKPFSGRVVYAEDMGGRRFSFYAPQVWTRQRRIVMPTARILGTHLSNAYEVVRMNEMIDAGLLEVTRPTLVDWTELPQAHQAMWENRHAGATYVCNHALPAAGLRSRDELYEAWGSGLRRRPSW